MPGGSSTSNDSNQPETYAWNVRLSDNAPQKVVGIGAIAVLAFFIGAFLFKNLALGLIGVAIILGSTAEFWLGSRFKIDRKGATVRTGFSLSAIEWADVKRITRDDGGIKLSPLEKVGTTDAFRGVYLRYGSHRAEVERAVLEFGQLSDNNVVDGPDGGGDGKAHPEGSR